jgi:acetoin utilization deacetylase AcuC-like enzyme
MLKTKKNIGIIFFPAYDWAISPTHPEREERLLYTQDQIKEEGLFDIQGIKEFKPLIADNIQIERAHVCIPDVDSQATVSHRISAGGALKAAKIVMEEKVNAAFALVRPPGHHARRIVHGNRGFCNINIEAVMIEELRKKYNKKKIAVIDTDCHHGDGTQDIYYHDPDVLFISLHQDGRTLYPGSGFTNELGIGNGYGYTINVPLPPKTSDKGYLYVIENLVLPILEDFKPDIIVNSAGQDNHFTDPITNMNLTAVGYAKLNDLLSPDICVLEGGYSVEGALPYVNTGIILAMAGLNYSYVIEPNYNKEKLEEGADIMRRIKQIVQEQWSKWQFREELKEKHIKKREMITTKRTVFYDESGITEYQYENLFICNKCNSFYTVESTGDFYKILAFVIERNICDNCLDKAEELFKKVNKHRFDFVYFYNKKDDSYERYS